MGASLNWVAPSRYSCSSKLGGPVSRFLFGSPSKPIQEAVPFETCHTACPLESRPNRTGRGRRKKHRRPGGWHWLARRFGLAAIWAYTLGGSQPFAFQGVKGFPLHPLLNFLEGSEDSPEQISQVLSLKSGDWWTQSVLPVLDLRIATSCSNMGQVKCSRSSGSLSALHLLTDR